ncbi:MAG TPA: DUF4864 domain-containing protein [Opitutaceae bacterium]|nr:DUF4864 domain-containing protein [Opitutaceae bacterium]
MQRLFALGIVLLAGAVATRAQTAALRASTPEVRKEVVRTIDAQLGAFRRHDIAAAFSLAAPALQLAHPLPGFAAIVEVNYPEIWTNQRADYGIVRDDGTTATVLVHVTGAHGGASYDFTLVKQPAGWRVADVLRHEPTQDDAL